AHRAGELVAALDEPRKERERALETDGALTPGEEPAAELEVFQHGHPREEMTPLGDQDQSRTHGRGGRARRQHLTVERCLSVARHEAGQRLQQRALPAPFEPTIAVMRPATSSRSNPSRTRKPP